MVGLPIKTGDLLKKNGDFMGFYGDSMGFQWNPLVMTNSSPWEMTHL